MAVGLPREFWEEELAVPSRPCSCLASMFDVGLCCDTAAESSDCDRDWERELSGDVEREDEELKDDDRASEPGMLTGAEPTRSL